LRVVTVVMALFCLPAHAWDPTCKPIGELYQNGEAICNELFGDSFMYSTDEDKAYTMWWFGGASPNEAAAAANGLTVPSTCELEYNHKTAPGPEGNITECHPWKENACCDASTVKSAEALNKGYGAGYEWDRCGPMSDECARFFVQEACMYECDVTAGLYRKYTDEEAANASHPGFENKWAIHKMPIKASYCNAWHDACRNDYFCDSDDGYWGCNAQYWEKQEKAKAVAAAAAQQVLDDADADKKASRIIAVIISGVVLVVLLCAFLCYMARKEKKGQPLFHPLVDSDERRPSPAQPSKA